MSKHIEMARYVSVALTLTGFCVVLSFTLAQAFDWVPTDEEIQKYRKSWNPLSNGPIFVSGVDIHPQGQLTVHPFIFSRISEKQFGNDLRPRASDRLHGQKVC